MPGFGTQVAGAGFGLLLDELRNSQQYSQQKKLQGLQIKGNKEMGDYNYMKQMQMYDATNYDRQVKEMKEAGLNPAMIYGMGGAGGATTGNQGGQVTGGGAAPRGDSGMGMSLAQMEMMKAQKELILAETEKVKAETPNVPLSGEKTKAETEGITLDNQLKGKSMNDQLNIISTQAKQETQQLGIMETQNKLDAAARLDRQLEIANRALKLGFESTGADIANEHEREKILKTQQEVQESLAKVAQGWKGLTLQEVDLAIKTFLAEYTANHPGLGNVIGGVIQRIGAAFGKPNNEVKVNK